MESETAKARLGMKHFNTYKDESDEFYARTSTPVSFNLVLTLAATPVALGKSQTVLCLDVATALLLAETRDEVYIKIDADTLRLIRAILE